MPKMQTLNSRLIRFRNSLIDRIAGVQKHPALNDSKLNPANFSGRHIAAEVKMAIDQFKTAAMDEKGFTVNYINLRESRAYEEYRQYCSPRLREFDPNTLGTEEERLAFWINLYNALVLDGIINFDIKKSVSENRLGSISFFRRAAYIVGGLRLSLDDIEHGILRSNRGFPYLPGKHFAGNDPRLNWIISEIDPRVHFALNCASRSCPPVRAYTADKIVQQLDLASKNFVQSNVLVDAEKKILYNSAIFNWYKGDFGGREGVIEFIIKHMQEDALRKTIESERQSLRIKYYPYDWGLNTYIEPDGGIDHAAIDEITA